MRIDDLDELVADGVALAVHARVAVAADVVVNLGDEWVRVGDECVGRLGGRRNWFGENDAPGCGESKVGEHLRLLLCAARDVQIRQVIARLAEWRARQGNDRHNKRGSEALLLKIKAAKRKPLLRESAV